MLYNIDRYVLLILLKFQQSFFIFTIAKEKYTDDIARASE